MAVLTDQERKEVWREYMRGISRDREAFGALDKSDIRAAVNALDTWLNDNAATINAALPEPAKTELTTEQKARLLTAVVAKRYIVGA